MGIAAFSTKLMSGQRQVETATVVCPTGVITVSGDIRATMTSAILGGGTEVMDVAVLANDTSAIVAQKIAAFINLNADFLAHFVAIADGADVVVEAILPAANEVAQNLALAVVAPCAGMSAAPTSADTIDGIAFTEIARVTNPVGPALKADMIDLTAHDSPGGFEESTPTVLRTGEVSMDINYEPDHATHDGTTGILFRYLQSMLGAYQLRFPDVGHTQFSFDAYVTSFVPSEPVAGKVTAAVSFKLNGVPTLTDVYI